MNNEILELLKENDSLLEQAGQLDGLHSLEQSEAMEDYIDNLNY